MTTRRLPTMTVVRSPLAGLGATMDNRKTPCAHTNSSASLTTLGGHIRSLSKYTCFSKNVVYAINCRTCNKMYIEETGRRLGDRLREHLRSTRLPDTDLPVGCHFTSPDHSVGDMLVSMIRSGFQSPTERDSFEARMIFGYRTLQPAGLQLYLNFSKSARAYNVSLCFGFYLNVTLRVLFFSCFKSPRKRQHPRKVWVFRALSKHILINFVKVTFREGPLCLPI